MQHSSKTLLAALGVVLVCPTLLNAQASPAPAPAQATVSPQVVRPIVVAKIDKTVTTKSLKAGDAIVAKTLRPVKTSDGSELPKGSKLIGKVVLVRSKQAGGGNSLLVFRIDQAEEKGGTLVNFHGLVIGIGPSLGPKDSLGQGSVMSRGGQGSTPGLDPNTGLGGNGARDEYDIARGSTIEGVSLGTHKDADWSTALEGIKRDILLDSDVVIKVQVM
jgi:hypothetical protein